MTETSSRSVRVLPDDLANQIAAGEVVERPASVVKELVENALDAGAKRITVDIEGGGVVLIRVADDGVGMNRDDAETATLRHATSKIRVLDDLRAVGSFGFRGEALPSIASVSRFSLRTRQRGQAEGTEITIEGGAPARVAPAGSAEGTVIEVRDLFFNVPVRRKFLRAVNAESAQITEVVEAAALAAPEVTFVLTRDGKRAREWLRVDDREQRANDTFRGEPLAPCLGGRGPLAVEAYLGRPERARAGATALRVLVNGRPVRDRQLSRAIAMGYGSVLEPGRYPIGVVYLDLPHELVDVNVHPQKAEVRFADGRAVTGALIRVLEEALRAAFGLQPSASSLEVKPSLFDEGSRAAVAPWLWASAPAPEGLAPPTPTPDAPSAAPPAASARTPYPAMAEPPVALVSDMSNEPKPAYGTLRFLAQARRMFLLCEGSDGLYVLDQHAAAERVTFHRLRRAFTTRSVAVQRLLFPELIEATAAEIALVEEAESEIHATGLEVRAAGPAALAVHTVPQLLARADPRRLLRDLLDELERGGERAFSAKIDLALATMACHGSVRAGDIVAPQEAAELLAALDDVDFGGHCPHGRPIVTRLGWNELAHAVGRR